MKRYPVYKDSGVEGLGEIPEHWEVKRLASLGKFSKGSTISKSDLAENGLPVILYGDIYTKYNLRAETIFHFISQDLAANSKQIYKGDLLFTGSGETREDIGKCIVYNGNSEVYAGGDIIIFRQKTNDSLFLAYFFSSNYAINKKAMNSRGDIVVHIYASSLRDIYIPIPPLSEQKTIAHFLDYKIEQIEQYIRNKQRLIELLNEQKTAIINRAVTKGINPNAPMKHSGIEWLGEIPAHWEVIKISRIAKIVNGTTPDKSRLKYWKSGSIPWISSGKVNDYIITQPTEQITEAAFKECSLRIMPAGAVVIGLVGQGKTRGKSARLAIDTCINQNLACIIPKLNLDSVFLHFVLIALYNPIRELARGGNQEALNCQLIGEIRIPFPPISEQQVIAAYIDMKSAEINISINQIQKSIELIQEYRTTLISDAVTGKIDVRGFDNANDTGNSPKPPELATM